MPTSAAGRLRARCTRAPWLTRPTAQVLGTLYANSTATRRRPTRVMRWPRVVCALRSAGLTPVIAVELEFYLLERDADGRLVPSAGLLSG